MFAIGTENDLVIVDLCGRRRDLLLGPDDAEHMASVLNVMALRADTGDPALVRGEQWEALVDVFDGRVCIRFVPPLSGWTDRVPMTPTAARQIAALLTAKAPQARAMVKINFVQRWGHG